MSSKQKQYLIYSQLLNVAADTNNIMDEEYDEVGGVGDIDDFTECMDFTSEEDGEWNEIDDFLNDDYRSEVDILQCIMNIIDLEDILKENDQKTVRKRQRRWGVHPINQMRREQGHFQNLFKEMRAFDHDKFFNYTRMTPARFDHLLKLVSSAISKNAPNAILPECRLLLTLRYFHSSYLQADKIFNFKFFSFLATGDSLKSLHYNFRVGITTAYNIIVETCEALWVRLSPVYLKFPSEEDWLKIAAGFRDKLNFPNCVGAGDGKLVEMYAPRHSGSMYFNYQKYFSTNLFAICDAHKNFVYVDIGSYGKQSDGGVLFHSTFGKRLDTNNLNLPPPAPLPNTNTRFPFFIIADSAYPLKENLLTPYAGNYSNLSDVQANFNNELSSVRKVIENSFAILVRRWQVFTGPIQMQAERVEKILKATVVLHNYIKSFDDEATIRYMREERCKYPSTSALSNFYESELRLNSAPESQYAHNLRNVYANYLKIT